MLSGSLGASFIQGSKSTAVDERTRCLGLVALLLLGHLPGVADASAWLLEPGQVRLRTVYFQEIAEEKFASGVDCFDCDPGEVIPLSPFDAQSSFRSVSLELAVGLPHGFEAEISAPFVRSELHDDQDEFFETRENTGVSDVWFFLRKSIPSPVAAALVFKTKAPTGDFQFVDGTVPSGEGQWDVGLGLETGGSAPLVDYWMLEIETRFRFERAATRERPGNELHVFAGTGVDLFQAAGFDVGLSGYLSWLRGGLFSEDGIELPQSQRSRLVPWAALSVQAPTPFGIRADLGFGRAVQGRNLPLGNQYFVAISRIFRPTI